MCIILIKDKGVDIPSKEILHNCWNNNDDGAGFTFARNGSVTIKKGFMTWKSFYKAFKRYKFTKEDSLICHFRIATSGNVDSGNTHPFPITKDAEMLRASEVDTDYAMAHNGIFSIKDDKDSRLSDTQAFIRKIVSNVSIDKLYTSDSMQQLMEKYIIGSRLAFLNSEGNILKLGNGWEENNKLWFSNSGYTTRGRFGSYYSEYAWENYYTDYNHCSKYDYNKSESEKEKSNKCPVCGAVMLNIVSKTGVYEYCPDCEISYYDQKGKQTTHYHRSKPLRFSCPLCTFGSNSFNDVTEHLESMHFYSQNKAIMSVIEEKKEDDEITYCQLCHAEIPANEGYRDITGFALCDTCLEKD